MADCAGIAIELIGERLAFQSIEFEICEYENRPWRRRAVALADGRSIRPFRIYSDLSVSAIQLLSFLASLRTYTTMSFPCYNDCFDILAIPTLRIIYVITSALDNTSYFEFALALDLGA